MTIGTEAIFKKNLIIASFDENLRKKMALIFLLIQ